MSAGHGACALSTAHVHLGGERQPHNEANPKNRLWPLSRFAATDSGVVEQFNEGDAFGQLLGAAGRVAEQHAEMPGADVAAMYIAAADFVGAVYPDRLDYIDRVLSSCYDVRSCPGRRLACLLATSVFWHSAQVLQAQCSKCRAMGCSGGCLALTIVQASELSTSLLDEPCPVCGAQAMASRGDAREDRTEKQMVALLTLPLTAYDPVTVLGLSTYPRVMSLLKPATCKVVLGTFLRMIVDLRDSCPAAGCHCKRGCMNFTGGLSCCCRGWL